MTRLDPSAIDIAQRAQSLAMLTDIATACTACVACPDLVESRTLVVPGDTPPGARLLLVGEAPGAQEDQAGRPFVGKAGALLDELMSAAGLSRADTAVLNVLKCRPPKNRTPTRAEAHRCQGWLDRQVELVNPTLVMTLGRTALTWAMSASVTLAQVRGREHAWRGRRLVASYHPSAAIRFGPRGAPRAALDQDLRLVAGLLA